MVYIAFIYSLWSIPHSNPSFCLRSTSNSLEALGLKEVEFFIRPCAMCGNQTMRTRFDMIHRSKVRNVQAPQICQRQEKPVVTKLAKMSISIRKGVLGADVEFHFHRNLEPKQNNPTPKWPCRCGKQESRISLPNQMYTQDSEECMSHLRLLGN